MNETRREAIIRDLLVKKPKGPADNRATYSANGEEWSSAFGRHRYITRWECDQEVFGYSDEDLFDLQLHNRTQVDCYIRKILYQNRGHGALTSGEKGGCSRRVGRIWRRIAVAIQRVRRAGGEGIYRVGRRYSDSIGHIFAGSQSEAETSANMFYGYLLGPDGGSLNVEYIRRGSVTEMISLNRDLVGQIKEKLKSDADTLKYYTDRIELNEARLSALALVEEQQLAAVLGTDA